MIHEIVKEIIQILAIFEGSNLNFLLLKIYNSNFQLYYNICANWQLTMIPVVREHIMSWYLFDGISKHA